MPIVSIIGTPLSPYVRKVLAACTLKGVEFFLDPIVPFFGNDKFTALSPLRRIPVLIDGDVVLADSTVICEYLEEKYPSPALLPKAVKARATARWIEEFADTRMGDVFIWRIFNKALISPAIWGTPRDSEGVAKAVSEELPDVMTYLESVAPDDGFLFGDIGIADIAVTVFFRNIRWSRVEPDAARWPKTMAWIGRTEAAPALAKLTAIADQLIRVPPPQQRDVLTKAGFALTEESVALSTPRRGPMSQ